MKHYTHEEIEDRDHIIVATKKERTTVENKVFGIDSVLGMIKLELSKETPIKRNIENMMAQIVCIASNTSE